MEVVDDGETRESANGSHRKGKLVPHLQKLVNYCELLGELFKSPKAAGKGLSKGTEREKSF